MIRVEIPIRLYSIPNVRWHWGRKKDHNKQARALARLALAAKVKPRRYPITVTITRVGKRRIDDDNLSGACKAIRDGVADWIGIDDGSDQYVWKYRQERGTDYACKIEIKEAPRRAR